nr:MAG TPA: tail protein [Caudoviricetes sp.]
MADDSDRWDNQQFDDYMDQPVRTGDHVQFASMETDCIRSAGTFVDGQLGEGFKLWRDENGITYLCLDKLTVRKTMTVMELLIEKMRSVGGMICVSAANGKIKAVSEREDSYYIEFEQDNTFEVHDLMCCQTFSGGQMKHYWVEVAEADTKGVKVFKGEFAGTLPEVSDEVVQMGNTENRKRQSVMLISAIEDGQPRVDVMDGVKAKNFKDCLRGRLGNLDGINDDRFPADQQPHGNGLYSDNAYLRGTFLLATGENIKTKFEIIEGKIASSVSALRKDFASDKGYLSNPSFDEGMSKWSTAIDPLLYWGDNIRGKKSTKANVTKDDGRVVMHIKDSYITQRSSDMKSAPPMRTNADGRKEAMCVRLTFLYRCAEEGTLKVWFEDVDMTGFEVFNPVMVEEVLTPTKSYKQFSYYGQWNGTGNFYLSFTGEIYLYMLILSTDKIENLVYKYRTLFDQSEKLVKIAAQNFDKYGRVLADSGIMVKADGSGIYAQGPDGQSALIGVAVEEADAEGNTHTVIKLLADNIKLEGLVTANGNFKILPDGSIEARNGKFKGTVKSNLYYGKTRIITDPQTYSINPETEPSICYFFNLNQPTSLPLPNSFLKLPSADLYDGIEIEVFVRVKRPDGRYFFDGSSVYILCQNTEEHLYVKQNLGFHSFKDENQAIYYEKTGVDFTDFIGNSVRIMEGYLSKFKAIGGAWYAIEGLFTGE